MASLYIHIGVAKTGTTNIQNLMCVNKDLLLQQGIRYLDSGRSQYGHHELAFRARTGDLTDWKLAAKEVQESSEPICVISSEELATLDSTQIEKIASCLTGIDYKIVVYLREQISFIESLYNQAIKSGDYSHSREEFLAQMLTGERCDYKILLKKWENICGRDNIIVRVYSPKTDVFTNFCSILGISPEGLNTGSGFKNEGIDNKYIEILRAINCLGIPIEKKNRLLVTPLLEKNGYEKPSGLAIYGSSERKLIRNYFKRSNAFVAKQYFDGENQELFDVAPLNVNTVPEEISPHLLVEVLAKFILVLSKQ